MGNGLHGNLHDLAANARLVLQTEYVALVALVALNGMSGGPSIVTASNRSRAAHPHPASSR